jgi:hypothetical protein
VLRSEVRKFFNSLLAGELSDASSTGGAGGANDRLAEHKLDCGLDTPTFHQNLNGGQVFPLFLTKREWLVLLDGTLKTPFFSRVGSDLSPSMSVVAWGQTENAGLYDLSESFLEGDEEMWEEEVGAGAEADIYMNSSGARGSTTASSTSATTILTEIDYDYFAINVWPQLSRRKEFSASLLWCEFTSFIKGSAESMITGVLTQQQYGAIGRKRAPNFKACRDDIYGQFLEYEKIRNRLHAFDLCDLIYHIYNELRGQAVAHLASGEGAFRNGYTGVPLHELFVDEVGV